MNVQQVMLPYQGKEDERVLRSMKYTPKKYMSSDQSIQIVYTGTKFGSNFNIKDKTTFDNQYNIVYRASCPNQNCDATYIGETGCRIQERLKNHSGRDHHSHLFKHSLATTNEILTNVDYEILSSSHRHTFNRKIAEALLIKKYQPSLNTQKNSVPLQLFLVAKELIS